MIIAAYTDKEKVVDILVNSFADNKSVNYIIKQDSRKAKRLKRLMEYSFDACYCFGEILLSNDKKACALVIFPDKKRTIFKSIAAAIKLIIGCMGLANIKKAMQREAAIKTIHPKELIYYLWFIGVAENEQGKGIGSTLMKEILTCSNTLNRTICLETSTLKNISWYKKFGFAVCNELDFGYTLYCLKRE
jgi:ribosomal protein S18 acetylase RimI-like enzyme